MTAVDPEARVNATEALVKIDAHLKECARRYDEHATALDEIKRQLGELSERIGKVASREVDWMTWIIRVSAVAAIVWIGDQMIELGDIARTIKAEVRESGQ